MEKSSDSRRANDWKVAGLQRTGSLSGMVVAFLLLAACAVPRPVEYSIHTLDPVTRKEREGVRVFWVYPIYIVDGQLSDPAFRNEFRNLSSPATTALPGGSEVFIWGEWIEAGETVRSQFKKIPVAWSSDEVVQHDLLLLRRK